MFEIEISVPLTLLFGCLCLTHIFRHCFVSRLYDNIFVARKCVCVCVWKREREGGGREESSAFPKWGSWPKSLVGQSWEFKKKKKFPFLQGVGTEWKHGWHTVCFCPWFSSSQEGYLPPMLEWKMRNLVAHYSLGDGMRTFFAMAGVFLWQTGRLLLETCSKWCCAPPQLSAASSVATSLCSTGALVMDCVGTRGATAWGLLLWKKMRSPQLDQWKKFLELWW